MASFYFHQAEIRISTSVLIVSITVNPARPRWVTLVSILNLVLLIMILGLVALKYADSLGGSFVGVPDFERRIVEVESFMMQVQTEFMNKTIESSEVGGLRREKEKENAGEVNHRFEKLSEMLEKKLGTVEFLRKEDFDKIFDDLMNVKGADIGDREVSLDEIRMVARDMLVKEMQRHASDGLGRVDYALSSGGAKVVRHSEPFIIGKVRRWFRKISPTTVYRDSEKMLKPSFGQPGQCFPLKGDSGFVQIRLGTTINPEAITLEHVDKAVVYDRSSAPKNCRVYGWHQGYNADIAVETRKMFLLTEFSYDLEKSNAQTFNVLDLVGSGLVLWTRSGLTSHRTMETITILASIGCESMVMSPPLFR